MRATHRNTCFVASSVLVVSLAVGCARTPEPGRAFYYWRTVFTLSEAERAALRDDRVARLYVRFFDVVNEGSSGKAWPVGRIAFHDPLPKGVEVVPVVFIANQVLQAKPDTSDLAAKVWTLVSSTARDAGAPFSELQVDCDWSDGTRDAFFAFCRALRACCLAGHARLSATIRLHQVKYKGRTGVPPVDRGALMFYNTGRITAKGGRCSIFNAEDAARYTSFLESYPLPLDVALAVFSCLSAAAEKRVNAVLGTGER